MALQLTVSVREIGLACCYSRRLGWILLWIVFNLSARGQNGNIDCLTQRTHCEENEKKDGKGKKTYIDS